MAEKRFGTHIVIKNEDVEKYLNEEGQKQFKALTEKILKRRKNEGKSIIYHVCNIDEPYANVVQDLILRGEDAYADGKTPEEGWEFKPGSEVEETIENVEPEPEVKDTDSPEDLLEEKEEKTEEYSPSEDIARYEERLKELDEFINALPDEQQKQIRTLEEEGKHQEAVELVEQSLKEDSTKETKDDDPGAES